MAKEMADERMKVNPDCWKRKHKKEKEPIAPLHPLATNMDAKDEIEPAAKKSKGNDK